jgi:CRISPR-associated protein Csy1
METTPPIYSRPEAAIQLAHAELSRNAIENGVRILLSIMPTVRGDAARSCAELLIRARRIEEATSLAERIAIEQPDCWRWLRTFAGHMRAKGELESSRRVLSAYSTAHASKPLARMRSDRAFALGLPSAYADSESLRDVRSVFMRRLQFFVDDYPPDKLVEMHAKPNDLVWDNFLLAYQGGNDRHAQTVFGDWLSNGLQTLLPAFVEAPPVPTRSRQRVAFVSSQLHGCTVGWYFSSWIEHLAQNGWEVMLVLTPGSHRDELTERLASFAHGEIACDGGLEENATRIRDLACDAIVYPELGMDGHLLALAALRLARMQVCAWGHPVTTGLPTIDVFLSCAAMEPPHAQEHYRERLVLLPGIGTCYASPPIPPPMSARELGIPDGRTPYLVPQALFKLHPDCDRILVEIVRRDPSALFVLFELKSPSPVLLVRDRLHRALREVVSDPQRHLFWIPECDRSDYLRVNSACAVMIDTLHWSGGNATLDALRSGLPVVTCPGEFMRSRQSAAMLRMLGCEELIATSPESLAEVAVSIAHDPKRRDDVVARIRGNLASLVNSDAALHALDTALRELVVTV